MVEPTTNGRCATKYSCRWMRFTCRWMSCYILRVMHGVDVSV